MDKCNKFGALSTDLSKVFVYIDHKLLVAKLFGYDIFQIELNALKLKQVTVIKVVPNMEFDKAEF